MKNRTGFVSNSSSSSFIIAYKDDKKPCPTCGHHNSSINTIKTVVSSDEEGGWKDLTLNAVLKQVKEDFVCNEDEEGYPKQEKEIAKMAEDGYSFAEVSFSIHGTATEALIDGDKSIKRITDGY